MGKGQERRTHFHFIIFLAQISRERYREWKREIRSAFNIKEANQTHFAQTHITYDAAKFKWRALLRLLFFDFSLATVCSHVSFYSINNRTENRFLVAVLFPSHLWSDDVDGEKSFEFFDGSGQDKNKNNKRLSLVVSHSVRADYARSSHTNTQTPSQARTQHQITMK